MPKSLTDLIDKITYDITLSDPNRISITTLNQSPRMRQLRLRHWKEIEEDYSDYIWMVMGSACHFILAKTKQDNRLIEEKIELKIDDVTIVSKPDLYDDNLKIVEDFKITSVYSVKNIKVEWEQQLNAYAWSLEKIGFPIKGLFINAILRDWSETEKKRFGEDYPPIPFKRIEVPLWTFEKQDKFIKERIELHQRCKNLPDNELPICSKEERWAKEDSWAIYKNSNLKATRVLNTEEEAKLYVDKSKNSLNKFRIEKRDGLDARCIKYCVCCLFCGYYKEKYAK